MTSKAGSNNGPWQIKRVSSITGLVESTLSDAIQQDTSVTGQTEILWKATTRRNGVINAYKVHNRTHDVLSYNKKQKRSSLGKYVRGDELNIMNYPSTFQGDGNTT